jgi:ABC-type transport system involved in multi-copper enzyme maturation permease subunit
MRIFNCCRRTKPMALIASNSNLAVRLGPCLAIFQHDLSSLWQSKLIRLWLAVTVVLTLMITLSNWEKMADAPLIAVMLFPYLVFPWPFVVIILSVTPVSGARTETLADGILSRPVTRHAYLLATWVARLVAVLGVYLVGTVPAIVLLTLAQRPAPQDHITVYGVITSLCVVGLVLTLIVSLGFLAGTLLRKPLLAVVVLVFVWYPVNLVLSAFSLEEFSPISLSRAIPIQLQMKLFNSNLDPDVAANLGGVEAVTNLLSDFGKAFSTPKPSNTYFDTNKFQDFSLLRVTLGYALPSLAAVILAVFCFYWRDL